MTRAILLILGWLVACLALWVLLVVLEIRWNLFDWQPKVDSLALGFGFGVSLVVACMWLLACASRKLAARGVSLVMCLALLVLGVYVLPAEPLSQGLFSRERVSPLWYRGGRLALLALPALFWRLAIFRQNNTAGQPDALLIGGPAKLSSNSGITEGPPSVS